MSDTSFERTTKGAWATGITLCAGVLLLMLGVFQVVDGIAAVAKDTVYVAGIDYVWEFDLTTWGWIHIVIGAIAAATGLGLVAQQDWARVAGICVAVLVAVGQFMFLPYYPFWAITVIGLSIAVIWALTASFGRD